MEQHTGCVPFLLLITYCLVTFLLLVFFSFSFTRHGGKYAEVLAAATTALPLGLAGVIMRSINLCGSKYFLSPFVLVR